MGDKIELRPAVPADALCLGVLGTQVYLDNYATEGVRPALARDVLAAFSTATMQAVLRRPGTQVVVAERGAHLIGFAQISLGTAQSLVQARRPAELDRLYVQEPFTARGVGSLLIGQAESLAAAAGADVMWLSLWVHNQRAQRFYAKHHYQDLGATWYVIENEKHQNRVLAKSFAAA